MEEDFKDFADYVVQHYAGSKVVEVGIGRESRVLRHLREAGIEAYATDVQPLEGVIRDDITMPKRHVYKGAGLIYSIRPPPELYPHLVAVARRVGADLIIKPLSTDACGIGELTGHKGTSFRILKKL